MTTNDEVLSRRGVPVVNEEEKAKLLAAMAQAPRDFGFDKMFAHNPPLRVIDYDD